MTAYGTWVSYAGSARVALCLGLTASAAAVAYGGSRVRRPLAAARPGRAAATFFVAIWGLAIAAFVVSLTVYATQEIHDYPGKPALTDHILPVTLTAALVTAGIICTRCPGKPRTRIVSAVVAAMAAPMIFEFPFDLIVMTRTYPAVVPHPGLYRAVFFVPLFLVELSTLALLTLAPAARLNSLTFYSFALMLTGFAIWALFGFGYPSSAAPITLNIVSKLLAFVTVLTLFYPERRPKQERVLRSASAGDVMGDVMGNASSARS